MSSDAGLALRLVDIAYGVPGINLYRLASLHGEPLPGFEPGAHIDLHVAPGVVRQYSLLWPPPAPDSLLIAVQEAADGRGGSRAWHHETVVGKTYAVSAPRNHFPLGPASPETTWLFAGGIGITPIISMYRKLLSDGRRVRLHYWARNPEAALFRTELADAADGRASLHYTGDGGPRLADVLADASSTAPLYCCGPARMVDAFDALTAGRPPALVHRELFAVAPMESAPGHSFTIRLLRSRLTLDVGRDETVLGACLAAGIDLSYSCEEGVCGACEIRVLSGQVDHRDRVLSPAARASAGTMMACCSRGLTTLELDI